MLAEKKTADPQSFGQDLKVVVFILARIELSPLIVLKLQTISYFSTRRSCLRPTTFLQVLLSKLLMVTEETNQWTRRFKGLKALSLVLANNLDLEWGHRAKLLLTLEGNAQVLRRPTSWCASLQEWSLSTQAKQKSLPCSVRLMKLTCLQILMWWHWTMTTQIDKICPLSSS